MAVVDPQPRLAPRPAADDYPRAPSVGPIGRLGRYTATHFRLVLVGWVLVALVLGFVVSIPFFNQTLYVGPAANALGGADVTYVVGFAVAAVLYWVLERSAGQTSVPVAAS